MILWIWCSKLMVCFCLGFSDNIFAQILYIYFAFSFVLYKITLWEVTCKTRVLKDFLINNGPFLKEIGPHRYYQNIKHISFCRLSPINYNSRNIHLSPFILTIGLILHEPNYEFKGFIETCSFRFLIWNQAVNFVSAEILF